jgi:DNA polymerase III alpha subunit (gram-positive type)
LPIRWETVKVKHNAGSYLVNRYTLGINGIRYNDLEDGVPLEYIKAQLEKIFKDNIVVGVNLNCDLTSLGLNMRDYVSFDLQTEYKSVVSNNGVPNVVGHSLKSLYKHYFGNTNFQLGVHTAESDAIATMRIFREIYVPYKTNAADCNQKESDNMYNHIERVPRK